MSHPQFEQPEAARPCMQKHTAIYSTLERIAQAEPRTLDIWSVSFSASAQPPPLLCSAEV